MHAFSLALRTLGREWRSGELGVLLLALIIAVAALTGVGFLVSRISTGVALTASEVLAADLRVSSRSPIDAAYFEEAARRGLQTARGTTLATVIFRGDEGKLANIRAMSEGYPLRGRLLVADEPFAAGTIAPGVPGPGEVWPDSKLLAAIGGRVGDTLTIGAASFRVTRVLISRPDQGSTFSDLAPSLLINEADLPATRLVQPGSRVRYLALFAGEGERIAAFRAWLDENRALGERVRDIEEASPQIRNAVDRAGRFLSLASLVSVLLCSIAVAMSARRYVQRHLDSVALLKTLGATHGFTLAVSLLQLLVIALIASVIGSAIGFAAQEWLVHVVRGMLEAELPPAGFAPLAIGLVTAIAVLAGFALPPLLQLARVPPIRVLRRDVGPPRPLVVLAFGPAVAAVVFLIYWVVRDWALFAGFAAGLAGFVALLAGAGALLVRFAGRLRSGAGVAWRYGIANLSRRRIESLVQIVAFGTGIMVLLLLSVVRRDLEDDWRQSLPENAPNHFFINIAPGEREEFVASMQAVGAEMSRVLPMIRGRITHMNGRPVDELEYRDEEHREEIVEDEQNITWAADLSGDNTIVSGRWWSPQEHGRPLVSLSTEYQEYLGAGVGDRLTFDIAGETLEVTIANFRKIKWDSFQPNFFVVFAPGLLDDAAGTYMTSAYVPPERRRALADIARRFPTLSMFDVEDLLNQVRSVVDRAVLAVQSVFLFTLFAGLTVLLAAVQASREERRFESAMLRTLGASRGIVLQGVLAEFTALGLLAGLLAALGASIAGYVMATHVLELSYGFDFGVWIAGLLGGALLVAGSGWMATRSVVRQPPVTTLRGG